MTKDNFESFTCYIKHELALRYEFHPCTTVLKRMCSSKRALEHFIKQAIRKKKKSMKKRKICIEHTLLVNTELLEKVTRKIFKHNITRDSPNQASSYTQIILSTLYLPPTLPPV